MFFQLFCLFSFLENPEGKYISPFHDIPLTVETDQVTLFLAEALVSVWAIKYSHKSNGQTSDQIEYMFLCQQDNDVAAKKPKRDSSEVLSIANILYNFWHKTFNPVYII